MKNYKRKNKESESGDNITCRPLQIIVNHSFEDAVRKFKSMCQKEKIANRVKEKQAFEKPSDKKRRKQRESEERRLVMEKRDEMIRSGEWEKRQQKKAEKRNEKYKQRQQQQQEAVKE
jgi:small subunit ribosomal protein S21